MAGGSRLIDRVPLWRDKPWLTAALTVALVGVSLVIRFATDHVLPPGFPFVTFFPAVIVSAFLFGTRNGAIAAALCGFAAWFWFIAPASHYAVTPGAIVAMLLYAFVVVTELAVIGWMQAAQSALTAERGRSETLAASRELMFSELQHRVSNNLQIAAGLIALQRKSIKDADARAALDEASRRLGVIGRISRSLYDPDGASLGLDRLLAKLCDDVIDATGRTDISVAVTADSQVMVPPDAAIPVALIVAEAVANAIEHGFGDGRSGRIDVNIARAADNRIAITVADTGRGVPDGFDPAASDSLGLRIATLFAQQLGGSFILAAGKSGAEARLSIAA